MKFLYFETDGDTTNGVCLPASSFVGADVSGANNAVDLYFSDLGGANTNDCKIVLNCTAGKTKEVVEALSKALDQGAATFVVVADDTNSEYISSHITSCGAITRAA
jgi:hypothetical protein